MLSIFGSLMLLQAAAAAPPLRIAFVDQPWAVEVDAPELAVEVNTTKPDGRRYLLTKQYEGFTLSMTLERISGTATAGGCRKAFKGRLKDQPFQVVDVKYSEFGPFTTLEYTIPAVQGVPLRQRSLFACMGRGETYVDLHISKIKFQESDRAFFDKVLKSARIVERTPMPPESAESLKYMAEASGYYLKGAYKQSIGPYRKALELEKGRRTLPIHYWRVLVDNLAMAHGLTGDLKAAEEVLQYGISQDPDYPMFYYNLACTHGERNDVAGAMRYLQEAGKRRANMIPGEKWPDPRSDDSFKRFLSDPEFLKIAELFYSAPK